MDCVTPPMVREVIQTILTDLDIEGSIVSSTSLYDNYLAGKTIASTIKLEIIRYTAAHFVSLRDASTRASSIEETIGDATIKLSNSDSWVGKASGLKSTRWGQTAILFDPSGIYSRLGLLPPKLYALTS